MERPRRHRSRQSGTRPREYAIVTVVEDWDQARQLSQALGQQGIPSQVKEHEGFAEETAWAIMVPEEHLDEAHLIVESECSFDDLYETDGDEDQMDQYEDLLDDQ